MWVPRCTSQNPPIFILLSSSLLSAPLLSFSGSSPCVVISQVPGTISTWTRILLNRLRLRWSVWMWIEDSWVLSDSRPAVSIPGATGGWYRAFFACPWDWLPLSRYPLVFLDLSPSLAYWFGSVPHRPTLRNIPAAPNTHVHLYASVISWDQLGKNMAADVPRYPSSTSAITLHSWLL